MRRLFGRAPLLSVIVVAVAGGCPPAEMSTAGPPETTTAPGETTTTGAGTTTGEATTDEVTTGEATAGPSSGSSGAPTALCPKDLFEPPSPCAPGEVCFQEFGGDTCSPNAVGECVPLPAGCTTDDLCAPACAGLCDNYNCARPEFCSDAGALGCNYDCGSQGSCGLAGTSCKPIAFPSEPTTWSLNHCVPTPDPGAKVGEPCMLQSDGDRLWDDCEPGAVCWITDPMQMTGTCRQQCALFDSPPCDVCVELAETNPFVTEPIAVCATPCDPLAPACPPDDRCLPVNLNGEARFVCAPDALGGAAAMYEPCDSWLACEVGLLCAAMAFAPPECDPMAGCCLPFCDTQAPQCPGGTSCEPFFMPGEAQPGLETLGVCVVP